MIKTVSAMEARNRLGSLMNAVSLTGDDFVIERAGKAMAVIISVEKFNQLINTDTAIYSASTKKTQKKKKLKFLHTGLWNGSGNETDIAENHDKYLYDVDVHNETI